MCRVVAYLGRPVELGVLLFDSDSSLSRQAYDPATMHGMNLAGNGFAAWDHDSFEPEVPFVYRDLSLPTYDRNLMRLSRKIRADCAMAHLRGESYLGGGYLARVTTENLHPFLFAGTRITLAHNGGLARFGQMKFDLLPHINPRWAEQIEGTTDSEWLYAVFLSRLADASGAASSQEMASALVDTLQIVRKVRDEHGISTVSGANLFVSDGRSIAATRFSYDFGHADGPLNERQRVYPTLWYTAGHHYGLHDGEWRMEGGLDDADSVLIASEPLSRDMSTWIEVPEYSVVTIDRKDGQITVSTADLDV